MSNPHLSPATCLALRDCADSCAADPLYAVVLVDRLALLIADRVAPDHPLAFLAGGLHHLADLQRDALATETGAVAGER